MPNDARWCRFRAFELSFSRLDGELVVYHTGSGDTHRLGEVSAAILETLPAEPEQARVIAARAAARLGVEADESFVDAVDSQLAELVKLDLAERIIP